MKIGDNVAMLDISGGRMGISPTLVWDEHNRILFDTGMPGQREQFEQAIAQEGFKLTELTHIILTHQDMDHIGGLKEMAALIPGVEVLAHELEAPYINGEKTPAKVAKQEADPNLTPERKLQLQEQKANHKNMAVPVTRLLKDGEILPFCGGIMIVHTPGHTPGHICAYLQKSKIIVAGDGLNRTEGQLNGANPIHTMDMNMAKDSLGKLLPLDIDAVVCYHGGLYRGDCNAALRDAMERMID